MEKLQIIPLGGLGEVGKNMTVFEYGRNILVVDVGMMFPHSDMPGIDYIIPDYRYLRGKEDRIRGVVITHGHEDHIGALPHFLEEFNAPVYATKLTRGLIEVKLNRDLRKRIKLQTIAPGEVLHIGPFDVEPYHVCHSIPDAVGLGITTPVGLIVHSGDYKFDHTPVDGRPTDIAKLAEFNQRGVLALLGDSTNSDHPGMTPSEQMITPALESIFSDAPGRIIVATFASLISRIQQVMDVAARFGRKVAIAGSTMVKNVKMARKLGYLNVPNDLILPLQEVNRLPPHQVAIIATGSQGEPRSIMGRLATGKHASLHIVPGDTVVLSSHTIPGNEETVHQVINMIFQKGANVMYHPLAPVHVSGHASQAEQQMLINILRPRYFIPIHGELRHLKQHAILAQEVGIPKENIAVVENGYVLRLTANSLTVGERVPGGYVFVDGSLVGEALSPDVLRSRHEMAASGVCSIVFRYDQRLGKMIGDPQISTRGIASDEILAEMLIQIELHVRRIIKTLPPRTPPSEVEKAVRRTISNFFYEKAQNRPVMLVTAVPII